MAAVMAAATAAARGKAAMGNAAMGKAAMGTAGWVGKEAVEMCFGKEPASTEAVCGGAWTTRLQKQ
eukprot:1764562-Prymnesium_polylepis.1